MAKNIKRDDPIGQTVHRFIPAGTMGNSDSKHYPIHSVRATFDVATGTTSTANVGMFSWINPEPTTILVSDVAVIFGKTGTGGTFDMGISSDGTGSSDIIFDGGTNDPGAGVAVRSHRVGGTGTGGTLGGTAWILGPGGVGTNNSIVGKQSEVTSTALGWVIIYYMPVVGSGEN